MKKAISVCLAIALLLMTASALAEISATWSDGTLTVSTTDTVGMNMIVIDGNDTGKYVGDTSPSQSFSIPEDGKTHTVTTIPWFGATGGSATFVAGETTPVDPGENWDEGVVTKEPTCEEPGVKTYTDKNDPTKTKTEEIPALGHKIEKIEGKAATCTEAGMSEGETCSVCGKVLKEQAEIPALGHQWDGGKVAKAATIEEEGELVYTCELCGETKSEVIPKINPKTGPLEVSVIGYDRMVLTFNVTNLAPLPGEAWVDGVSTGITVNYGVNSINVFLKQGKHTLTIHGNGETAYDTFDVPAPTAPVVADAAYADGVLTFQLTDLNGLGEIWISGENGGTAENNGIISVSIALEPGDYTLLVHDSMYGLTSNTVSFHVHKLVPIGEAKEATCTEEGLTAGSKCELCGKDVEPQAVIEKLPHTIEVLEGKEPTCTEAGLTEGEKCSVCGEIVKEQEEIPALGHKTEVIPGKEATCTEAGLTDGEKCSVCGEIVKEQEEIPALGHKAEVIPGKEATCTKPGLTDGEKCSVCGEIIKAQENIPALDHDYVPQNPKAVLRQEYVCSRCGDTFKQDIKKSARNGYGSILKNANGEFVDYVAEIDAKDGKILVITADKENAGAEWVSEIGMYLTKDLIAQIQKEGFEKIAYVNGDVKLTFALKDLSDRLFVAASAIMEYVITLDPEGNGGCLVKLEATLQSGEKVEAAEFKAMKLESVNGQSIQVTTNGVYPV